MGVCDVAFGVNLGETASSADLGGSSKYSNENFEDQSGERVSCEQQLDMS